MNQRLKYGNWETAGIFLMICLLMNGCASLQTRPRTAGETARDGKVSASEAVVQGREKASTDDIGTRVSSTETVRDGRTAAGQISEATGVACTDQASCGQDTPVLDEDPCMDADARMREAHQLGVQGKWKKAFENAVLSSVCEAWALSSGNFAFHAVTQMDTDTLEQLWREATQPLAVAASGLEIMRRCVASEDPECVSGHLEMTYTALEEVGRADEMGPVMSWLQDSQISGNSVVAVALPLSGRDRKMGRAMLGAFLQASGIYAHKGVSFDLRFYDTRSDASTLPEILADAHHIGARLMLGPVDIQEAATAATAATAYPMIVLSFAPNPAFLRENGQAYMMSFGLEKEADRLAEKLRLSGATKVIAAYPENRYGDKVIDLLKPRLPSGVSLKSMTYPAQETDLRKLAQNVAAERPDVILLPSEAKDAERFMSFVAQENMWCQTTADARRGTPKNKNDMRQWVTCLSTSVWSPISPTHDLKFLAGAQYLDYTASVADGEGFAVMFEKLYHRRPNVQEMLPYAVMRLLSGVPAESFRDIQSLGQVFGDIFSGERIYYLEPSFQEVFL